MPHLLNHRHALSLAASLALPSFAQSTAAWGDIERKARGQTVYFNAWGGGGNINDDIH